MHGSLLAVCIIDFLARAPHRTQLWHNRRGTMVESPTPCEPAMTRPQHGLGIRVRPAVSCLIMQHCQGTWLCAYVYHFDNHEAHAWRHETARAIGSQFCLGTRTPTTGSVQHPWCPATARPHHAFLWRTQFPRPDLLQAAEVVLPLSQQPCLLTSEACTRKHKIPRSNTYTPPAT